MDDIFIEKTFYLDVVYVTLSIFVDNRHRFTPISIQVWVKKN